MAKDTIKLSDHFSYGRLIRYTIPSIVTMIFSSVYGIVDGLFVSNFVGSSAFAAVNLIMPFIMILTAVGFMIGTGGSALVAYTFGKGEDNEARAIFSLLSYVCIGVGIVLAVSGFIFIRPISVLLGATDDMMKYCVIYGRITMVSLTAFMLQNLFQSFLITAEKPRLGLAVTIVAGCTNMILDAVFVGLLKMGVAGAAWATVCSECVGGLVPLIYFALPNSSTLRLGAPALKIRYVLKACGNGISEFLSNIAMSVVAIVFNLQLLRLAGENGVSAYGVIMYVCFIFIGVFYGFEVGSAPIIGYHHGAGDRDELKSLKRKSLILIGAAAVFLTAAAEALARPICMIFVSYDAELLELSVRAFRIYSLSFLLAGFNLFGSSFFTALNNGAVSALISVSRTFVFQIAAVLILPMIMGLDGIWSAIIVSEIWCLAVTVICLLSNRKKYGY